MFDFKKVKVRKTRIFLVDLYARTSNGRELLTKKDCLAVATNQGLVNFEEIKDFSKEELKLYEKNGFIAHFVMSKRGHEMMTYTKNTRPLYPLNEPGFVSYKQAVKYLQAKQDAEIEK